MVSSIASSPHFRTGRGKVPSSSLLSAAWKELLEYPSVSATGAAAKGLGTQIDFTKDGLTMAQFRTFFEEAINAAKKVEAIVESGNKYGVHADFTKMNGEILFQQIKCSGNYKALSGKDRARADDFFSLMCFNGDLRNRNPLHPTPLDSAVIGNLVNFPKHIFSFPYGGWSTNGHEALSLCLFSYRQESKAWKNNVVYVLADGEQSPFESLAGICTRLQMELQVVEELGESCSAAVVLTSFTNPALDKIAARAASAGVNVHVHLLDSQLRDILTSSEEPVHFELPENVRSLSIHEGLLNCGYQLYRDLILRDLHFDLPYVWQTAYMSPNEGGSGNSTPLFIDFCFILLGWSALRDMAMKGTPDPVSEPLNPILLGPQTLADVKFPVPQGPDSFDKIISWAKDNMDKPRTDLEKILVQFQRNFVGGKGRDVEAIVTSGGTRSINFSFESVISRARKSLEPDTKLKVITGNPHLAVERAERRFSFELVRVDEDGVLQVDALKNAIQDPLVVAVYAQTLSFTDGITDPVPEILDALEEENKKRQAKNDPKVLPITLINDCCLALSILIHNDGKNNSPNFRILDRSDGYITPTIAMLDAHKHLGADKGISMTMGTPGTLSHLNGLVRVGGAPSRGELVRAIADLSLVGVDGYYEKYHSLASQIGDVLSKIEAAGMTIIHSKHRVKGSTVFAVEDPSAVMARKLKKRGHGTSPIYALCPSRPERCQTGFQLSLTPHCLRQHRDGTPALQIFAKDVVECHKAAKSSGGFLANMFKESSLAAFVLRGGDTGIWSFALLQKPGLGRDLVSLILRRLYSAIMDSGRACSNRNPHALSVVSKRFFFVAFLQVVALLFFRRRLRKSSKM